MLEAGEKIDEWIVTMFDKLDIWPFELKIKILSFLVEGTLYGPDVLEIDNSTIIDKF